VTDPVVIDGDGVLETQRRENPLTRRAAVEPHLRDDWRVDVLEQPRSQGGPNPFPAVLGDDTEGLQVDNRLVTVERAPSR
jgi:hypothetical protein